MENWLEISMEELKSLLIFECSALDADRLTRTVNEDEIKSVLFAMQSNKAPGPDEYTTKIFKEGWRVIKKDFVVAIQSFFEKGFLTKGINSTI